MGCRGAAVGLKGVASAASAVESWQKVVVDRPAEDAAVLVEAQVAILGRVGTARFETVHPRVEREGGTCAARVAAWVAAWVAASLPLLQSKVASCTMTAPPPPLAPPAEVRVLVRQ